MNEHYLKIVSEFKRKAHTYDENHENYSIMGLHEEVRRTIVKKLILSNYGNLLDIGCGTCWYLKNFSDRFSCFGTDISFHMLRQRKKKNLKIFSSLGEELPIKSEKIDCVICINMFQYVKNPLVLFLEIKRVLNKNGFFIFDFKNLFSPRAVMHYFNRVFRDEYDSDKEKRYSIFKIKKLINSSNFDIKEIRGTEFHILSTSQKIMPKFFIKILKIIELMLSRSPLKFFSGRLILCITQQNN